MPTYEYACEKCDHHFEVEQRITDDPIKTCPSCRSRKVKRLISQTSFVLKGGGWYSDLYSSPRSKEASSGEKSGDGASESKGAGSSESSGSESSKTSGSDDGKKSSGKSKGAKAVA